MNSQSSTPTADKVRPTIPLISIIIVVRNGKSTLARAIESISRQSFKNFELIIVDGVSTDGTLDVIGANNQVVHNWISEPDRGIYDAMNKGVGLARGEWVYFLGCDDVLLECLGQVAVRLVDKRAIYYGNVVKTGSETVYDGKFSSWKLLRRNICHQAMFYPRSVFDRHQFSLSYPRLADWEFNLRCYADDKLRFEYIPVDIARYNDVTGVSATAKDQQFIRDQARIIRECLPLGCYAWYCAKQSAHKFNRLLFR